MKVRKFTEQHSLYGDTAMVKIIANAKDKEDVRKARDHAAFLRKRGYELFCEERVTSLLLHITLTDRFDKEWARNEDLSVVLGDLRKIGLSPCIVLRGVRSKSVWRVHIDAGRNWWADSKYLTVAFRRAFALWDKAGRPIGEDKAAKLAAQLF